MTAGCNERLWYGAYNGDLALVRAALEDGADVESAEAGTGLTALHLAVGRSHLELAQFLIEEAGAQVKPDGFGRWPSLIAVQCRAASAVCVYMAKAELERG